MAATTPSIILAAISLALSSLTNGATVTFPLIINGANFEIPEGSSIVLRNTEEGRPTVLPVSLPDSVNIGRGSRLVPNINDPFGSSFTFVTADVFAGQRLTIDKPTRLLGARAEFEILSEAPFLSIVPLSHPDWFPHGPEDLVRRSTHDFLLDRLQGSVASGQTDILLQPGDYAVILGGGGLFGSGLNPGSLSLQNRAPDDTRDFFASADQAILWGDLLFNGVARSQTFTDESLNLQLSTKVIPEPSTYLLGLFALGFALLHRRRS